MNTQHIKYILFTLLLVCAAGIARAFSPDIYAGTSVMNRGRWVKISVQQSGLHMVSLSDIRAWGFDDPSKVRVYGYGGQRLPDQLTASGYIDDLPVVQSELTSRGIVFYAMGPQTETTDNYEYKYLTPNPYSSLGYYFLSNAGSDAREIPVEGSVPSATSAFTTSFTEVVQHETDSYSPAQSGHLLLGEDFRFTPTRKFSFNLPGRVADTDAMMRVEFYAKTSGSLQLTFSHNNNVLTPSSADVIKSTTGWSAPAVLHRSLPAGGEQLNIGITASNVGTLSQSNLDRISINYERHLALPNTGRLEFTLESSPARLTGAGENTRIWDVTDPGSVKRMLHGVSEGGAVWKNDYYGTRRYAAWNENASFLTPKVAGVIANQNLHGEQTPDMVIITHSTLRDQAQRIATLHSSTVGELRVLVVTPENIYNEFSSGTPDINGMRRMLKMFYDRGADESGHRLQYVLLLGSANYDHRRLTAAWQRSTQATVPIWQTDNGHEESFSFSTDDFIGFLEDNSGVNISSDKLCVAIGRIPAHSANEAKIFTDRLITYCTTPPDGPWRSRIMLVADNGNDNIHMSQTDEMETHFRNMFKGQNMDYQKIYVDAYEQIGGETTQARERFMNLLSDGTVWWNYVGHSSMTEMGSEGLLKLKDLDNLYLRRPPFYYGATCSFAHWDGDDYCGLEMLTLSDAGGLIGGISATRPVYITMNGFLTSALGYELFDTDSDGSMRPIGEIYRRAKNSVGSDSNKLRYIMLGDPAMYLAIPANTVRLDRINGNEVLPDDGVSDPVIITALGKTTLSGAVCDNGGQVLESFNGYVDLTLYDAERSVTTQGRDNKDAGPYTYEDQGNQLYTGRVPVTNGQWMCEFVLPPEISDNFRNATLTMYARTDDSSVTACGANRDFYVYGYDENAIIDDIPPVIESMYLNHETFANGDAVNSTPMLLARVSDNTGLNMSQSGIGHQMSLRIDDNLTYSDLSLSFIPDSNGFPSGDIAYQLPELMPGSHTATLKVWDVGGNSTTATIDFTVDLNQEPKIFDVYTDANPATVSANFYIAHNRPDAMLSVRIDIHDLSGRMIWSETTRGRADMYLTAPVRWDLTNSAGARVGRGIYVYRATVTTDAVGNTPAVSSSVAKRIAVAPF